MESITIKLSSEIASKYQQISDQDRKNIQKQIEKIINFEVEKIKKVANNNLSKLMDKASEEAEANGLTPEILQEILNEDE